MARKHAPTDEPTRDEAPAAPAKAQSEIGPTSYTEADGIVKHGPNDPETKAAYAAGHPADGIVKTRAARGGEAAPITDGKSVPGSRTTEVVNGPGTKAPRRRAPAPKTPAKRR